MSPAEKKCPRELPCRDYFLSPSLGIATQAIHLGQHENGLSQFPVPALICNSATLLNSIEEGREMLGNAEQENFAYQRYANPTVSILEAKFRAIEHCSYSLAVNSGMTACLLAFRALLSAGDHVIVPHSVFYEIIEQLNYEVNHRGIEMSLIDKYQAAAFECAIQPNTKMIFIEAPTNPAFLDINIPDLVELCNKRGILLVVDNTFLTPACQKPLSLGAAVTLYSITKHINGHGDVMGGMISTNEPDLFKALKYHRDSAGLIVDPFSAWLTIRGLRTLPLRLKKHTDNAHAVIAMLREEFPKLEWRAVWSTKSAQTNGISPSLHTGLIAIVFPSRETATTFVRHLQLIRIGTTFGNIESLCYHYGSFSREGSTDLEKIGVPDGLVRISVGLEDSDDINADIRRALRLAMQSRTTARG
ncbi:trans-sulfuration enzyme family protein [Pseudomonas sp. NPDC087612]|uniref:trans-sulfuration enzyme family protein n=1 Tax=unclassified Pseudomonas TaxID=196821 RepID=UPI0009E2027D|nr:PLP-dependent aspartate aminotransferase family protein [Pseudomonas sp. 2(2015)]